MRSLARWGALPLVITPLGSWALGLGEIEPGSYLNQPLYAEIPLSATADELAALSVSMAPSAEFARRGLDRPGFLSSFTFDIVRNADGQNIIRVTSTRSITEPFVTLVVEARLPGRTQFREYTVLLDPPLFLPNEAAVEPVAPPVAREPADSGAGAIDRPASSVPVVQPTPRPAPATPEPAGEPAPAPRTLEAPTVASSGGDYTVVGGDTLWAIASRNRPSGVTMNQTMMSIYQANPAAFGGNINVLRRGAILRIPPSSELATMSAADATAEVARQTAAWSTGAEPAPQLVLLPPSDEPSLSIGAGEPNAVPAGGASTDGETVAIADDVPVDQVRSVGEESGDDGRLLELQSAELADLQNRLDAGAEAGASLTEDGASADEPGTDAALAAATAAGLGAAGSEVDPLVADSDAGSGADPAAPEVAEPAQVFVDESEPAETPAAEAETQASPVARSAPAEPSFFESVLAFLARPLFLIAAGVLAVLAAAFAFLRRRQDSLEDVTGQWEALESEVEEEIDSQGFAASTSNRTEPSMTVVESPALDAAAAAAVAAGDDAAAYESGTVEISAPTNVDVEPDNFEDDFEFDAELPGEDVRNAAFAEQTLSNQTVINLDQADPIAEADFHMAYGLYDQAADLIGKALESDPGNRELRLKLLEVYFVWGNKAQFLEQAQLLQGEIGAGGGADWDKVVIMGKQICPDETLFSGGMSAAPEVDLELTSDSGSAGLDFTLEDADDEVDFGLATIDDAEIALERESESELADSAVVDLGALGDDAEESADDSMIAGLDLDALDAELDEVEESRDAEAETRESPALAADEDSDFMLDIGERTQAGLEAAFLDLDEEGDESGVHAETAFDIGSDRVPGEEDELDTLDAGQAATETSDADEEEDELEAASEAALEEEALAAADEQHEEADEAAELEDLQSVAMARAASGGGDTIEHVRPAATGQHEMTTELELDDLGLDVSDIKDLPHDLGEPGTAEFAMKHAATEEDDLLSATGVTEVLRDDMVLDDDPELEQTGTVAFDDGDLDDGAFDDGDSIGIRTEVLEQPVGRFDPDAADADEDLDLNLDDFSSALDGGATAEQPGLSGYGIDLDVGDGIAGADAPAIGTEDIGSLDPQTMTEVGTKLDLARAYIDMGDPEGAKSILEEVITEGDSGQRSEAQALINALPA